MMEKKVELAGFLDERNNKDYLHIDSLPRDFNDNFFHEVTRTLHQLFQWKYENVSNLSLTHQ